MVSSIRNIEVSLGDGTKNITQSERKNVLIARKSIVASCDIELVKFFRIQILLLNDLLQGLILCVGMMY